MSFYQPIPGFKRVDFESPEIEEFDMMRCDAINIIEGGEADILLEYEDRYCHGKVARIARLLNEKGLYKALPMWLECTVMYDYGRTGEGLWIVLDEIMLADEGARDVTVSHEYLMRLDSGRVSQAYHGIQMTPEMLGLVDDKTLSDDQAMEAASGAGILRATFGGFTELFAVDCEYAHEMLSELYDPRPNMS